MQPDQQYQQYQQYAQPPGPPPGMMAANSAKRHHPWGLIISLILFVLLFLGASSFGVWAYMGRQQYKNETDKITAKAVEVAIQQEDSKKDNEFLEREKTPLKTYQGPAAYGSLDISYPKTWAGYVIQTDRASIPVDGYFHPNYVPGVQSGTAYALRIQVTSQSYEQEMRQFEGKVKAGKATVKAYAPKNVPGVAGSRVDGEINNGQKDSMVLLPLRDKTIKISTESQEFVGDFDKIVLENLKFVP
ncbi:MAG TPA: hypothetical protein VM124_03260 [Candidatus Limnocylindrales bacterium]|nr:hypothetical protein [Candidatus Limnocylindrales bacterium]